MRRQQEHVTFCQLVAPLPVGKRAAVIVLFKRTGDGEVVDPNCCALPANRIVRQGDDIFEERPVLADISPTFQPGSVLQCRRECDHIANFRYCFRGECPNCVEPPRNTVCSVPDDPDRMGWAG